MLTYKELKKAKSAKSYYKGLESVINENKANVSVETIKELICEAEGRQGTDISVELSVAVALLVGAAAVWVQVDTGKGELAGALMMLGAVVILVIAIVIVIVMKKMLNKEKFILRYLELKLREYES